MISNLSILLKVHFFFLAMALKKGLWSPPEVWLLCTRSRRPSMPRSREPSVTNFTRSFCTMMMMMMMMVMMMMMMMMMTGIVM